MKSHTDFQGSLSLSETASLRELGLLDEARSHGYLPELRGAAETFPAPITSPLGPPTISGTTYTIDFLLNNPTRVTRILANLVMRNFFLDKVFNTGGGVEGGAVLYDQAYLIDVYTDRDVERVQPGAEFPIVTGARPAPLVAVVEKFGGKFPVTDEAIRRNDVGAVTRQMNKLANTIIRKMHQRGIVELEAAITAFSRTVASTATWKAAAEEARLNQVPLKSPVDVIYKALENVEGLEVGYEYDTLIVSPADMRFLRSYFGGQADLEAAFRDVGINNVIPTPRKAAKTAILTAGRQVGEMRLEEPMRTVTEREGAPELREQTWIQTAVNPVFFVTDPYAALELTGLS